MEIYNQNRILEQNILDGIKVLLKKSSLTFAPEAGSQRMRNVINKGLTEDDILSGSKMAFERAIEAPFKCRKMVSQ